MKRQTEPQRPDSQLRRSRSRQVALHFIYTRGVCRQKKTLRVNVIYWRSTLRQKGLYILCFPRSFPTPQRWASPRGVSSADGMVEPACNSPFSRTLPLTLYTSHKKETLRHHISGQVTAWHARYARGIGRHTPFRRMAQSPIGSSTATERMSRE